MKIISLILLVLLTDFTSYSQNYIQLNKDTVINEIKFFKNEIYESPFLDTQDVQAKFIFGNEEISVLRNDYNTVSDIKNYSVLKDSFVKRLNPTSYSVKLSGDQIPEQGKLITAAFQTVTLTRAPKTIAVAKAGRVFRIILPNSPTIVYDTLQMPAAHSSSSVVHTKKSVFRRIILPILVLLGALFIPLAIYASTRKTNLQYITEEIRAPFKGGLYAFASDRKIKIEKLVKLNSPLLDGYLKLSPDKKTNLEKELIRENIELVIGHKKVLKNNIPVTEMTGNPTATIKDLPPVMTTGTQVLQSDGTTILTEIRLFEQRITSKIEILSLNNAVLEEKNTLSREKESLLLKLNALSEERDAFQKEAGIIREEKKNAEMISKKYAARLLFVEFLDTYAKTATDYFALLKTTLTSAYNYLKKLSAINEKDAAVLGFLLARSQDEIPPKTGHWEEITEGIRNAGIISNSDLIRSFSQLPNNEEKIRTFQRLLSREVLEKYTSAVLLLTEELRNFSKFTNENNGTTRDIEVTFASLSKDILNKAKTVGLQVNYVPLFVNYESYASITRAVSENRSLPYINIPVEKDSIAEILSYGFGNEATKIILA